MDQFEYAVPIEPALSDSSNGAAIVEEQDKATNMAIQSYLPG